MNTTTVASTTLSVVGRTHQCGCLKDRGGGQRTACRARASWRVGVVLRGKRAHERVTVYVRLICCNVCCKQLEVEDVVNDKGFRHWAPLARQHGFRPRRRKTRLTFGRLGDPSLPPEAR